MTLELPPPGVGLTTVMECVADDAMLAARTAACNCPWLTNVVCSAVPSKSMVEFDRKPVPFTVKVNAGPPGAVELGTNGCVRNGTGLFGFLSRLRIGAGAGDFAGINDRAGALPFADMGVQVQRLPEGHPDRALYPLADSPHSTSALTPYRVCRSPAGAT